MMRPSQRSSRADSVGSSAVGAERASWARSRDAAARSGSVGPADTLSPESKKALIDAVTDAYAAVYGERARATVLVLVDEVPDGGWGLGGTILTAELLGRS